MRVAHRYVTVDGRRTHLLHGEGTVGTVFLHGVGGSSWTFDATLKALDRPGWASVDLLGYGESSWLADGDYSSARQAKQLRGVLDRLGVGRVNLVGFSWGGLIGLELSRDSRLDKLVVIDVAPSSELAATQVPPIPETYPAMPDATRAILRLAPRADPEVAERDASLSTTADRDGFRKKVDPRLLTRWQFRDEDHWDTWRGNARETLLVRGEHSPVLSSREARLMLDDHPNVSFVEIPDSGHLIPLEQPCALAAALADFLG